MNFAPVEKIASAILYEGYILYPYRPTAIKNRQRWNFGTLYPSLYAEAQRPQEPCRFITECLVVPGQTATLELKLSFLQLMRQPGNSGNDFGAPADASLEWDEAVERTFESGRLVIGSLLISPVDLALAPAPEIRVRLTIAATRLASGASKLHIELENVTEPPSGVRAGRDEALPLALVSAHMLLGVHGGEFVSLLDPPEPFASDAKNCVNTGVFPVLAGEEPDRSIMLVSPIILYDYPKTAPESAGDFFDGTEMDEMLALRVLTLTDAEKAEMRSGDPRARRILERTESLTSEQMLEVHGVIRQMRALRPGVEEDIR